MKRNLQFLSMLLLMIVGGASFSWAQTNLLTVEGVTISGQDLGNGKAAIDFTTNIGADENFRVSLMHA